jgi:hypothetical protein
VEYRTCAFFKVQYSRRHRHVRRMRRTCVSSKTTSNCMSQLEIARRLFSHLREGPVNVMYLHTAVSSRKYSGKSAWTATVVWSRWPKTGLAAFICFLRRFAPSHTSIFSGPLRCIANPTEYANERRPGHKLEMRPKLEYTLSCARTTCSYSTSRP